MKDPKRLLDEETGLGQRLLREAQAVPPIPKHLLRRTLGAISVAGGLAPVASAAVELSSRASVLAPAGASLGKSSLLIIVKWTAGGLAIGALATSSGMLLHRQTTTASVPNAAPSLGPAVAVRAKREPTHVRAAPSAALPMARVTRPAAPPASNPARFPPHRLGEEAASLDEAARAVASKNPERALELLDLHGREFPRGQLVPEAALIRLQALELKQDHAAADRLARELLSRRPYGRYADRVRAVWGQRP